MNIDQTSTPAPDEATRRVATRNALHELLGQATDPDDVALICRVIEDFVCRPSRRSLDVLELLRQPLLTPPVRLVLLRAAFGHFIPATRH